MYQINQNCVACGNCIAECPVGAIIEGDVYYIDTDMAERTAVDDGLDSGIHYSRFKQGNYFKNLSRASLVGKEIRNTLKNLIMPYGTWT